MRNLIFILALLCGSTQAVAITAGEPPAQAAPASRSTTGVAAAEPSAAALKSALAQYVKGLTLDEARLRAHVIRPQHIIGVTSDLGLDEGKVQFTRKKPPAPGTAHLVVNVFGQSLHNALKGVVAGYVMRLRQHGNTIYTLQWNWAQTPADGSKGWNPQRQMHVASVSKLITGIALARVLQEKGVSPDAKIIGYLPTYWSKGANIDKITFRHLMTHTSGFGADDPDYSTMKAAVAAGVSTNSAMPDFIGNYHYRNLNYGLCRILIAVLNGNIAKNAIFNDQMWDIITIFAYDQYVQSKVFTPSGVTTATLSHPAAGVLAYKFPVTTAGWDSGDLQSVSGAAGWHLSVDQLLDVMGTLRRKGTILSPAAAQTLLDDHFGIDQTIDSPAGKLYNKNGLWHDANNNGRTEQSLAYFLPDDMELVVLANSPIGNPEQSFRGVVNQIYVDSFPEAIHEREVAFQRQACLTQCGEDQKACLSDAGPGQKPACIQEYLQCKKSCS